MLKLEKDLKMLLPARNDIFCWLLNFVYLISFGRFDVFVYLNYIYFTNMSLDLENYHCTLGEHNAKRVIWIAFKNDEVLKQNLRNQLKVYWSATKKSWYTLDLKRHRELLGIPLEQVGQRIIGKIHSTNQVHFVRFRELLALKCYSHNTAQIYCAEFGHFLATLKHVDANSLDQERLRSYFVYCATVLKLKENHLNSRLNAIKFFYEKVMHRQRFFIDIPRPKKPSLLPKAIHKADIKKMFGVVQNPKHQLMLKLCYGLGLRVSEIVALKITDIDSKNMQVLIRQSKGKKDRYVNLPESILPQLRQYYKAFRPTEYLLEGQRGGAYTTRSVQAVFKKALKDAKINKAVGVHSLRHSYATHLLEAGTDISFIKELMGHNNIKTTMVYTKMANRLLAKIKSPLDDMGLA